MVKIHNFRLFPTEYYARGKNNMLPVLVDCLNPQCYFHGVLWRNGFYERNAIWFDGPHRIRIQRYRYPVCRHTVSLLPSFLAPTLKTTSPDVTCGGNAEEALPLAFGGNFPGRVH